MTLTEALAILNDLNHPLRDDAWEVVDAANNSYAERHTAAGLEC